MFAQYRSRRRPRVELTPMIDIMFYLVLFFMVFGTFRTDTAGVPLDLPRAATAADLARDHLVVTVGVDGRLYFDGRVVSDADLTRSLLPVLKSQPDRVVIVKADRAISYERLIQAIDAIRMAGGAKLALAVERAPRAGGVTP
ncbi:MAG: Biopolymer transport protein ExbD [Firmicutes bacterium ADurb.Bin506]|nr:MAG: Biopolymer transport protein ExbD [Firmicutes bacterium ADurb.Bin506]